MTPSRTQTILATVALAAVLGCAPDSSNAQSPAATTKPQAPSKPQARRYVKKSDEELKKILTPQQFAVTRKNATERPFQNEFWDNSEEGIYVDVVSGEPLFSSNDKYDSGTGWPSFTKPLEPANIRTKTDREMFMERTEVRSANADSHLGHVFDDGPKPAGLRYCMNSAAMRFVPVSKLEAAGYGEYLKLFKRK